MARLPHLGRCAGPDQERGQFCPSPVASPILCTSPVRAGGAAGSAAYRLLPTPGTPVSSPILGTSPVPRDRCYLQGAPGASPILGTSPKPCGPTMFFIPVAASPLAGASPSAAAAGFFPEPAPSGTRTPDSGVGSEEEDAESEEPEAEADAEADADTSPARRRPYVVKNSFIDTPMQRSPSLERFYGERKIHSSPPSIAVDLSREENPFMIATPSGSSVGDFDFEGMTASAQVLEKDLTAVVPRGKYGYAGDSDVGGSTRVGSASELLRHSSAGSGRFSDVSKAVSAVEEPVIGSAELPSRGSALHKWGACKPCAFVGQGLCRNDINCEFCHLCEPGEKKRRRREWLETKRDLRRQDDGSFAESSSFAEGPSPVPAPAAARVSAR